GQQRANDPTRWKGPILVVSHRRQKRHAVRELRRILGDFGKLGRQDVSAQLETRLDGVERSAQALDVLGDLGLTPTIPLPALRIVAGKINFGRVEAGARLEPRASLGAKVHIVVVEAYPIDDNAIDVVAANDLLDQPALVVARRGVQRIEEDFAAVPSGK